MSGTRFTRRFIFVSVASALTMFASCGATQFTGGQVKAAKVTANGPLAKSVQASFVVQTPVALEVFSKANDKLLPQEIVGPAGLPFHLGFNVERLAIEGMADLQDLAVPNVKGKFGVRGGGVEGEVQYDLTVLPPEVKGHECSVAVPVIGDIKPVEMWHWAGWTNPANSDHYQLTYSSPVAGDLDHDGKTEIVTTISTGNYSQNGVQDFNGPLVVLEGATGNVLWNSYLAGGPGASAGVEVSTTPAIADLDGDGFAEIIFATVIHRASVQTRQITVLDYHTRTVKATYSDVGFVCGNYCMVAVADIDGDGKAEIVAGNVILDNNAHFKHWLLPTPTFGSYGSNVPTLADLVPSSPGLEVISGHGVYSSAGAMLFTVASGGAQTTTFAVGDIDKDGHAELVCVGNGKVMVYNDTVTNGPGELRWSKDIPVRTMPSETGGGAPNIGDFNGDGKWEIGTAGGDYYVVYSYDGKELWKQATVDTSSHSTGSTIFDFNGDGKVEVVYNDQEKLRIYDGATGAILWEIANPSGTLWEFPLIVNLDDDASVEIVVSAPGLGGTRAFKDPSHQWVTSRRVWNQYSYYPEIVSDNLTTPVVNASPAQGFRVNTQGSPNRDGKVLLPDLAIVAPLFADDSSTAASADEKPVLSFFVMNKGEAMAAKGSDLKVYSRDKAKLLGSLTLDAELAVGEGKLVSVALTQSLPDITGLIVEVGKNADGSTEMRECSADNNAVPFDLKALHR